MAHRTELEIGILNPEATESFFERLRRAFSDLKNEGKTAFGEVSKGAGDLLKTGLGAAISAQAMELTNAITRPMRTSFSEAIEAAKQYRGVVTDVAIGTGKSFESTNQSIRQSAESVAESHQTVLSFSKAVQATTGYWLEGSRAIDAYEDRAKFLGKTLGEMSSQAGALSTLFDLRDGDRISMFFNAMNMQAEKLGVNAKTASLQFDQMAGTMARMTSASPEKLSAVSSSFLKAAGGNKERATIIQQGVMNFMSSRLPYIEDEMRAKGKINKNESILDDTGRIREDLFIPILKSEQAYIKRHFKKDSWREKMRILGQGNVFGNPIAAAGFLKLDTNAMEDVAQIKARPIRSSLERFLQSDAGKRAQRDEKKDEKDTQVGNMFLSMQDKAAESAGGWSGIVGDTLSKVGMGAVMLKVGQKAIAKMLPRAATQVASSASTAATIGETALSGSAASLGGSSLRLLSRGLGPMGMVAGFMLSPDTLNQGEASDLKREKETRAEWDRYLNQLSPQERKQKEDSDRAKGSLEFELRGIRNYEKDHSNPWGRFWQKVGGVQEPLLSKEAEEKISKLLPEDIKALANEFGQDLVKRILRVQMMPTPASPPKGEENHP